MDPPATAEAAAGEEGVAEDLEDEDEELLLQRLAPPLTYTYQRLRPSRSTM